MGGGGCHCDGGVEICVGVAGLVGGGDPKTIGPISNEIVYRPAMGDEGRKSSVQSLGEAKPKPLPPAGFDRLSMKE